MAGGTIIRGMGSASANPLEPPTWPRLLCRRGRMWSKRLRTQQNVGSYGLIDIDAILLTGIAHNRPDPPIVWVFG